MYVCIFLLFYSFDTVPLIFIFTEAFIEEFTSISSLIFILLKPFFEKFASVSSFIFLLLQVFLKILTLFSSFYQFAAAILIHTVPFLL